MMYHDFPLPYNYLKLYGQKTALLTHVERVSYSKLSRTILELSCTYREITKNEQGEDKTEMKMDELKKGSLILLLFFGEDKIPFVHIVNFRDATLRKYEGWVGDWFKLRYDCPNKSITEDMTRTECYICRDWGEYESN